MSLLNKLFGKKDNLVSAACNLAHTRGFQQQVVGEASYQANISKIVGGKKQYSAKHVCTALLVCDDNNQYDENAVEVRIEGLLVGYLSKTDAAEYREQLEKIDSRSPTTSVRAKIVGGWSDEDTEGEFGVKLNLKWPLQKA